MIEETTLSRRKLLKRAGIGAAAAAWTVPFLSSTASAGVDIESLRQRCTDGGLAPTCPSCGSVTCGTKNGTTCFCFVGVKGGIGSGCCECVGNFFCSGARACTSNADCPRGFKCTKTCCPGGTFCAPACGRGINSAGGSGLTAAG
jgi:hypothetical protein